MRNRKYDTHEPTYEIETEQADGCQGTGAGEGMEWEVGVGRCKLLHVEWINNKILLYNREPHSIFYDKV